MSIGALQQAMNVLRDEADDATNELADRLYEDGVARWYWDPEVVNVVGLVDVKTNRALVIVYLHDRDFETSLEFEEMKA
jgi:hypothetical protein